MKFVDFRTKVLLLSQRDTAEILSVSASTIYSLDKGNTVSKLMKGRLLDSLSRYLGRDVSDTEIDELARS